jgi:NADH-quinone oxidoreductase subunit F
MSKGIQIKNADDLVKIKQQYSKYIGKYKYRVAVCAGAGCVSSNCELVKEALLKSIKESKLQGKVLVVETGCMGTCDIGPIMLVMPDGVFYTKLTESDMPSIVSTHLVNGKIKMDKTYFDSKKGEYVPYIKDVDYFKNQVKIALRNCGEIDYSSLEEYIVS